MSRLVTATGLLIACTVLFFFDYLAYRSSVASNLQVQAEIVASSTRRALAFDDPATAEETLLALSANPRIEAAAIYRPGGELFAAYRREASLASPTVPDGMSLTLGEVRFDGLTVHVVSPHVLDGERTGTVYIRRDLQDVNERLRRDALVAAVVIFLGMGAAFVAFQILRRSVTEPVTQLVDVVTRVARDRDYSVRATGGGLDEVGLLTNAFNGMLDQIQERDRSLREHHELLEQRVKERTMELDTANRELEAFCYSVSHDLRSPLRGIDGFSLALLEDHASSLDDEARDYLKRIRAATQRMGMLIDDLLNLSRITRADLRNEAVDLSRMARQITSDLAAADPARKVDVVIAGDLMAEGDPRLLRQALENLLANAWKFTSKIDNPRIEVGRAALEGIPVFFVKDNGAGFDMQYADRLFGVFQRLHKAGEFPGTGVGLAIVERVIRRHRGRVWASARLNGGATFFFTLGTDTFEIPPSSTASYAVTP